MVPEADLRRAAAQRLSFYVVRKDRLPGRWVEVLRTTDLDDALERARLEKTSESGPVETGVFRESRSGGFLYWTSRHPDVFNSSVLDLGLA